MAGINKISLPFPSMNGGADWCILPGLRPSYPTDNGKRVSDTPDSWRADVAMQGNCFAPLTVKINGSANPLPGIDEDQIAEACASMKPIYVRLTDCVISVYGFDGLRMTAVARGIELARANK